VKASKRDTVSSKVEQMSQQAAQVIIRVRTQHQVAEAVIDLHASIHATFCAFIHMLYMHAQPVYMRGGTYSKPPTRPINKQSKLQTSILRTLAAQQYCLLHVSLLIHTSELLTP